MTILVAVPDMSLAPVLGDQDLHWLGYQLFPAIPEHALYGAIQKYDLPTAIDLKNSIRRQVQNFPEAIKHIVSRDSLRGHG